MAKYLTREQVNYIQGHLKLRGENTVTLAARLGLPWSTVAGTINGNRANPEARQGVADFLGQTVAELFGESIRSPGETPGPLDAGATGDAGATDASIIGEAERTAEVAHG